MKRRQIRMLVLILWPPLSWACMTTHIEVKSVESARPSQFYGTEIYGLQLKSGEYYRFRKSEPAKIVLSEVIGLAIIPEATPLDQVKNQVQEETGKITEFTDAQGKVHKPAFTLTQNGKLLAFYDDGPRHQVSLPFSNVRTITTEHSSLNALGIIGLVLLGAVVVGIAAGGAGGGYTPPPKNMNGDSCPFVYSFDGQDYALDGEPYGGAICRGLERTEWLPLDHLRESEGRYRLLVTNELEESEHTDEVKLVVVDHPAGTQVVPDASGRLHTISSPRAPLKATDAAGRDITPFLAAEDGYLWTGHPEAIDPDNAASFRDSLTLEFPKPAGARTVKLLANAWTTHQGSASAKSILALHGRDLGAYYREVDAHGPAYSRLLSWYADEELYLLKVWVETPGGWKPRGLIYGGGPFVAKDKAYVLDVSDVPGSVLRVRLNPPLDFWLLDRLAVDYSPDLNLQTQEISPASAIDRSGADVKAFLASTDGVTYDMPERGDRAELTFDAPARVPGLERSVLLKVSGYYDIHLEAKGEPQRALLDRIYGEPGFALRYTYQWRHGMEYAQPRPGAH